MHYSIQHVFPAIRAAIDERGFERAVGAIRFGQNFDGERIVSWNCADCRMARRNEDLRIGNDRFRVYSKERKISAATIVCPHYESRIVVESQWPWRLPEV